MPSKEDKKQSITAYDPESFIEKFDQDGAGQDHDMEPLAEHTKVEKWTDNGEPYLEEYRGNERLKGKTALVTGGDSGIGKSTAIFFAREGADISIVYLPEEQKDADNTKKDVEAAGQKCLLLPLDLSDTNNCRKAVEEHINAYGKLNILVNNASKQVQCKDLSEIDLASVESTFQTNIVSMIALTKFALPHMKRGAAIVNSASVTAYKGSVGMVDYASTKGAIISFTRSMAGQLAPKGIRINAVAPGPVYTPLQPASRSPEQMDGWGLGHPLHGRVGQPAELAPSYVFLADNGSSNFMTGGVLHVNGGQWFGS